MANFGHNAKDFLKYIKNHKCVYNADTGLKNWHNAIRRLNSGSQEKINVQICGDSISDGLLAGDEGSTTNWQNYYTKGFAGLLRAHFNAKYDDVGTGLIPSTETYNTASPPIFTQTGAWIYGPGGGIGGTSGVMNNIWLSITTNSTISFNFNGTGVTVYGLHNTTSNMDFTVTVDGGTPVAFNEHGASFINYASFDVTGLAPGNHTAVITVTGGEFWFGGIREIKGNRGVLFNNCTHGGYDASYANSESSLKFTMDQFQPTLTILSFLSNDYEHELYANYRANLQAVITRAKQYGDVLITNIGMVSNYDGYNPKQEAYIAIEKDLAVTNNCAYLNIYDYWGGYPGAVAKGFLGDYTHPSIAGHKSIADIMIKLLEV